MLWIGGIGSLVALIVGFGELKGAKGASQVLAVLCVVFGLLGIVATLVMIVVANSTPTYSAPSYYGGY